VVVLVVDLTLTAHLAVLAVELLVKLVTHELVELEHLDREMLVVIIQFLQTTAVVVVVEQAQSAAQELHLLLALVVQVLHPQLVELQ
jgi:hypothetical protein